MKPRTISRVPRGRPRSGSRHSVVRKHAGLRTPIVRLDSGEVFLDLLFQFGDPIDVSAADLEQVLRSTAKDGLLVARRLRGADLTFFSQMRESSDREVAGWLLADGPRRWRRRRHKPRQ